MNEIRTTWNAVGSWRRWRGSGGRVRMMRTRSRWPSATSSSKRRKIAKGPEVGGIEGNLKCWNEADVESGRHELEEEVMPMIERARRDYHAAVLRGEYDDDGK